MERYKVICTYKRTQNDVSSCSTHTTEIKFPTEETERAEFTKSHAPTISNDEDAHPAHERGWFQATR